jgi:PAS domain S-box-containing protein
MSAVNRFRRNDPVPALSRLLSDSALWKAALGVCGVPLALLDAAAAARPVTYVNPAFEGFFGYPAREALGRPLAQLVLRGDEPLAHRLLAESQSRWQIKAWTKDGTLRHVELSIGAVRSAEGRVTHWVAAFADRSELERLRAELDSLRRLDAAA